MRLTFIGSGDAFGSGGRYNTCFHVEGDSVDFLIDCGASSLVALKARRVALNRIQAIFVTHFHADHFGGLPFFMLDAQFFSKRTEPLAIVGPRGLASWYERTMELSFPGSSSTQPKFALSLVELDAGAPATIAGVRVTPYQAHHGNPGGPFFSYRLEAKGRTIAYTGDTEWTEALVPAARDADLFIAEAYFHDKPIKLHLDLATLARHLPRIAPRRLVLTHMSDDMLGRLPLAGYEAAYDGMVVEL
ncbi:MAG: MBL fold metallo-hydrolase [Proteobacteria bacterium]|nr:MBL fold metallo-hydrolase [Pseudomonadota bacterium]